MNDMTRADYELVRNQLEEETKTHRIGLMIAEAGLNRVRKLIDTFPKDDKPQEKPKAPKPSSYVG